MTKTGFYATLFIACYALSTSSAAQNIYKCSGATYSQTPCPDGVQLAPAQAPSRAEQIEADQTAKRDARVANRMEQERLRQEKRDLKANTPERTAKAPAAPATTTPTRNRTRKASKTQGFVAEVPGTRQPRVKHKANSAKNAD